MVQDSYSYGNKLVCMAISLIMKHLEIMKYWLKNSTDLSNRSCKAQLSFTIDYLTRALESKLQVDVAILDFEKAFD